MDATLRALNRFGLGARRDERRRITDARGWLRAQLDGGPSVVRSPEGVTPAIIGDAIRGLRQVVQGDEQARREARRKLAELAQAEAAAALAERVTSERPFVEHLVAFWSNHLCVSAGKAQVAPQAGSYERDVIRPHVLGRFEDMVMASARHPAMLTYLDNAQSVGPGSPGARAGQRNNGRRRGLNENYARELLELHTLGVNGGYTQQDVQELAKILTGWTVGGVGGPGGAAQMAADPRARRRAVLGRQAARGAADGPIGFVFQAALHEPGGKTLLGERYTEAGVAEGERAIRALCRHASTARFVATKLVTHFVSDEPPADAVDRVARAFSSSGGDLKVVARALVDEPEAWRETARKFRTPQEWFIAVMRGLGVRDVRPNTQNVLRQLRQPLWSPSSPKGFGDTLQDWADPDSLLNRGELARTISRLPAAGAVEPQALLDLVDVPAGDPLHAMLGDTSIRPADRVALAIAGPAFQWR
jgi:uncharacterized protein (DUF1800 family)